MLLIVNWQDYIDAGDRLHAYVPSMRYFLIRNLGGHLVDYLRPVILPSRAAAAEVW